jgi:hypothetical protein
MTAPLAPGAPESNPAAPAATEPPAAPTAQPEAASAPASATPAATPDNDVKSLPDWAQKLISDARSEAGKARTTAKQNAAEEAKKELAQTVAKALGIVEDETPDPAQLTAQVAEQTAAARQAQVELAIYRNADAASGDPGALLDSRNFLTAIKDVDPSDSAAIQAAITAAVTANPRLGRTEPVAPGMKPNPAQGRSASPPLGLAEQVAAAEKAGDHRTAIRLKAALALNSQP